jgi:rubredoxin
LEIPIIIHDFNINSNKRRDNSMNYKCEVCGYIYDPKAGDPDGSIAPGTNFKDLPEGWICPICGAGKDRFKPVD